MTFKALLAAKTGEAISTRVVEMNEQDLMPGDVTIAVDYSTVNYKDAMAITGRVDVIRQFPLIPGIDLAALAVLVASTVVMSLGLAPVFTIGNEMIITAAPPERAGAASAISETSSELSGALGIALLGSVGMVF